VLRLLTPEDEAGNMRIHARIGIRTEEFNECPVVASRSCSQRIEHRQLFTNLPLLLRCQVPAAHLVVVARATAVHHESTFGSQHRFESKMDGIRTTGGFSNRAHRSVHLSPALMPSLRKSFASSFVECIASYREGQLSTNRNTQGDQLRDFV